MHPLKQFAVNLFKTIYRRALPGIQDLEELVEMLRSAEHKHFIDPQTLAMMLGSLTIAKMQVREIMIPHSQMVSIRYEDSPEQFLPIIIESNHSRYPVIDEQDEIKGILLVKDLLGFLNSNEEESFEMRDFLRPALFVPESKRLNALLQQFRRNRNHMAIVVDEYGKVAGLVTIEDILEQIVGTIHDEYDVEHEYQIRAIGKDLYTVLGETSLDDFNEYFNCNLQDEEYSTVAGLMLRTFGRLPKRGETAQIGEFEFKILRSDPRKIALLQVSRQQRVAAPTEH